MFSKNHTKKIQLKGVFFSGHPVYVYFHGFESKQFKT